MNKVFIDTGGTKTRLTIGGRRMESKGFGLSDDSISPLNEAADDWRNLCGRAGVAAAEVDAVYVNLGGKNKRQIEATLRAVFPAAECYVYRESEGEAARALGLKYDAGVVALAGTGCIVVTYNALSGKGSVSDGWGANWGDAGSGYEIGMKAVRRTLYEADGTKPLSLLARTLGGTDSPIPILSDYRQIASLRDELRGRFTGLGRREIAAFTRTVAACAAAGDRGAIEILTEAAESLGASVARAAKKTGFASPPKAVVTGGLIRLGPIWRDALVRAAGGVCETVVFAEDGVLEGLRALSEKREENQ